MLTGLFVKTKIQMRENKRYNGSTENNFRFNLYWTNYGSICIEKRIITHKTMKENKTPTLTPTMDCAILSPKNLWVSKGPATTHSNVPTW